MSFIYCFSIFNINLECFEWYRLQSNPPSPHFTQLSLSEPTLPPIGEWYDIWTLSYCGVSNHYYEFSRLSQTIKEWLRTTLLYAVIILATLRYCLSRQYKGASTLVNPKCPPICEWYDIWTVALAVLIHCIRLPRAWFLHLGLPGLLQYCRRWTTLLSRRQENESQSG